MAAQLALTHPKYRSDIDGLRAIAVFAVIAFHAFPNWIQGGYMGVDVFFVISGYLISTIIFSNLNTDTFSMKEFYARRIRRIFPALIVVLSACFIAAWFTLFADEFKQLSKHIAAGAGFVSNITFLREAGYFDNAGDTKPLLHLWSLGIEEQFYLCWPLFIYVCHQRKWNLLIVTLLVLFGSFSLNINGVGHDMVATFFAPQTRIWELLSGSLLAWWHLHRGHTEVTTTKDIKRHGASFLGFLLLLSGFFFIGKNVAFPGFYALIPVIAAVLIIDAGQGTLLNQLILSNPVAVWFGLISFPLYLWHWPILSYLRIIESGMVTSSVKMLAVGISIVLAWITYRFLESPIRTRKWRRVSSLRLLVMMLLIFIVSGVTYLTDGVPSRDIVTMSYHTAYSGWDGGDGGFLEDQCGVTPEESNLYGMCKHDKRGHIKYALLGDSKAAALAAGLVRTSTEQGRWLIIGGNGKNGAPVPVISDAAEYAANQKLTRLAVDTISKNTEVQEVLIVTAIRAIFLIKQDTTAGYIGSYNYRYLEKLKATQNYDQVYVGLKKVISAFVNSGKKVTLLTDNPSLPETRDCEGRKTSIKSLNLLLGIDTRGASSECYISLSAFNEQIALYRKLLAQLQHDFPGAVRVLDATDVFCDVKTDVCGPSRYGKFLYSSTDHMSDYAAGLVGQRMNEVLLEK